MAALLWLNQATAQFISISKPQRSALALAYVDAPNNFPTTALQVGDNVTIVQHPSDTALNVVGLALHDPQGLFPGWIRAGEAANIRASRSL